MALNPGYLSDEQLEELSRDETHPSAVAIAEEVKRRATLKSAQAVPNRPFDPRNEVSADARYIADQVAKEGRAIVITLWIVLVGIPVLLGVLYALLK